ncbi:serine-rich adhesin for platelets-like [Haliotis cracherodii]|uniref:serine-rich adhesin for platelets-like n=1 Tax=Haliotis cracherodii TaxID=6455 RepID=UPI0039EB3D1F
MDRIFQRVLEWNVGETSSDSMKFRNVGAIKTRSASSGLLDLRVTAHKKARQKVLIIPDEEEDDIPFPKMKFAHKPDFQEIAEISSLKEMYPVSQSVKFRPHLNGDSSGKSNRSFSISTSSLSTDVSSWQESNKRDVFQRRNTSNFTDSNHNQRQHCTSEDNPPSFPPAQPLDYYPPFNPFLPVNAERILINLGFSGSDCLLPERFLKDWYQKMAKAQKEWGQSQQFSDCQESVDENSLPSMGTSGRTTPNQVCLYPEHFPMNCLPGKSLQRSATVSSYQYPEGLDISTKTHCKEQKRFGASGEFGSSKRRRQWANTRQKSLPLFLETLNEEDESRSRRTSIDQFSQFKAFLKEEMMSVKSGGSSQDNNIDSDSDSSNSAALINFSKSISEIPEAGKQDDNKCMPSISISTKSEVDQKEKKVAHEHISHETLPSTDSLEVADIMQYQQNKNNGAGPLEPAMVSIVLEDVDGNVTDSVCNSTSFLSVDNLHIPLSGSSSTSPILSPVTVIEVGRLDNQMDSLDTDESTSVSKESDSLASNKGSFDSDRCKCESGPDDCKVRKVILEGKVIGHQSCSFPNPALKDITKERSEASASQCSFVQVDDGRLSPIVTFPSVQVLQEWFDGTTDYYVAQDRSVQCEMEAGMFQALDEEDCQDVHSVHLQVTQAEQYTQTDPEQLFSKSLSDKSSQISTQTVSCSVQTTIDTMEDDDEDCQWLHQKVLASTMICQNKCGLKHDADKTVTTSPSLMALDHILVPPRDRRHSITDDWVISNFRAQSQSEEISINLETDISERKDWADEANKPTVYPEVPVESEFTSDSTDGKTGSQCNDQKELMLNEDGSPMTKLDIFANDFLTGAEEKCSQLRLASDTSFPDSERRHSLLSSTLSNESWGTQNTVISMPKPHRALLSMCNESEVGDIDSGQTITHKNNNGGVESPFSTTLKTLQKINTDKKNCEPYLRSSSDSLSLSVDEDDDVGSSAISSSMSVQSDWEMDDISGFVSASEADSDGILPKIVMDSKETVHIKHGEMEMELIDRCIDSCTIVKNQEFLHKKKQCEAQFGVFGLDGIGETELNVALGENDFGSNNRFEQVSLESSNIPKDVKDVDRNDSDSSLSQNSGLCQGEVLSGSNDCENGRGRKAMTVQRADAKKKFLSQFFINTYTQNLSENVSERRPPTVEKNYNKQNTYWKSSSGSHLGLSQVKQMTTIYESDHSESESGDGCRALRGSRHPDITKSCTWNGSNLPKFLPPGSRSLTDGTGENSMEQGFAQLARKAFISQKAERITSPCESSDGEAGYGSGLSEIQDNTCNAAKPISSSFNEFRSESGVYGTLSNDSIEHSMEQAEMEDSPPEQDVLQIYQATSEQEHTHMYSDQKKEARYISSKTFMFSPTVSVNAANSDSQMVSKVCMAAPGGFQLNEDNSFIPIVSAISTNPQTMLTSSSLRRTVFPRQKGISSVKHGNICTAPSSNKVLMTSKIKMRLVTSLNSKSTSSTNSFSPITPSSSRDGNSVETSSCSSSTKSLVTEQESLRTTTPDQVETTNSTAKDEVMTESVGPAQTEAWLYSSSGPQMNTSNNMSPDRITTRQKSVEFSFKKGCSKSEMTQGDLLESSPYRNSYSSMQMSPSIDKENLAVDILNAEDNQSKFQDCKTDKPEDVSVHNMNNKLSLRSQDAEQALHYQGRSSTHVLCESEAFNSNGIPSQCLSQTNNISVRHPSLENPHGLSFNGLSTEIHSIRQEREEGKQHSVEDGLGRVLRSIEIQLKPVEGDFECKELSLIPGFRLHQGYKERQQNPLVAEPPPANSDRLHKSLVAEPPPADSDRPHKSLVAGPPPADSNRPHKSLVAEPPPANSDRPHKSLVAEPPPADSNRPHKSLVAEPPPANSDRPHKSLVAEPPPANSDRPHKSLVAEPPPANSDRPHKSLVAEPPPADSDRPHKSLVAGPPPADSDRPHKSLVAGPPPANSDRPHKSLVAEPPPADSDRPHKSLVAEPPPANSDRPHKSLVAGPPPADSDRPHKSLVAEPPPANSDRPHKSLVAGPPPADSDRPHKSLVAEPPPANSDRPHKSLVAEPPPANSDRPHKSLVAEPPPADSDRPHKSLVAEPPPADSDRPHKSLVAGPLLADSDRPHKSLVAGPPLADSNRLHKSLVTGPPLADSNRPHKSLVTGPPLTDSDRLHKSLVARPPLTDSDRPHKSLVAGPPLTDSDRPHKSLVAGPPLTDSDRPHKCRVTGPPLTDSDRPHKSLVAGQPLTDSDRPHKSLVAGPPLADSNRQHKSLVTGPPLADSDRPHKSLVAKPRLADSNRLHKSLVAGPLLADSDRLQKSLVAGPPLTDYDRQHKSLVAGPPLADSNRLHKSLVTGPPLADSNRPHKSLVTGPPLTDSDRLHKSLVARPPLTDSDRPHKSLVAGPPLTDSDRPHKSLVAGPPLTDSDRPHKCRVTGPPLTDSDRPHKSLVAGQPLTDSDRPHKSLVAGPPLADSNRQHKSLVTGPPLADSDRPHKSLVAKPRLADSNRLHKSLVAGPLLADSDRLQKSLVAGPPLTDYDRQHKSLVAGPPLTDSDRPHKSLVTGPPLADSDRPHKSRVAGPPLTDSNRPHKSRVARRLLADSDRLHTSLVAGPPLTDSNRPHKSRVARRLLADSDRLHKSLVAGPPLTDSDRPHKSLVSGPTLTDSDRLHKSRVTGPPLTDSDRPHTTRVAGPPLTDSNRLHKSRVTGPPLTDSDRPHMARVTGPLLADSDRLLKSRVAGPLLADSDRPHKSRVTGPPLTEFDRLTWQARQNEKEEKEVRLGPRSGKALSNGLEKRRPESAVSDIRSKFEPRDITPSRHQSCVSSPKRPVNTYIMKLASKFEYS